MRVWTLAGGACAVLALVVALAAYPGERASADVAMMRVRPPSQNVYADSQTFDVEITLEGGVSVATWEFGIKYEPEMVELLDVTEGPFLASGGKPTQCFRADHKPGEPGLGAVGVQYGCGVPGAAEFAGVSGDGVLATLHLRPKQDGASDMLFFRRELGLNFGGGINVDSADGIVQIVAPGVPEPPLLPTPTPNPANIVEVPAVCDPNELNLACQPGYRASSGQNDGDNGGPGSPGGNNSGGPTGVTQFPPGSSQAAGANSGSSGSGANSGGAGAGNLAVAGTGPQPDGRDGRWVWGSAALLAAGGLLVLAGELRKRRQRQP